VLGIFAYGIDHVGGCEIYRIISPFRELGSKAGWKTNYLPMESAASVRLSDYNLIVTARSHETEEMRQAALQSPYTQAAIRAGILDPDTQSPFFDSVRRMGIKVVYEVDDDFTNEHRIVRGGGEDAMHLARQCDAITVSTPYLAQVMRRVTGKPVYVVPNCIDPAIWGAPGYERVVDGLTIALSGSPTHYQDWMVLAEVMPKILAKYPQVKLILSGFRPDYFDDLPAEQVLRVPPLSYAQYPGIFRSADIVLAPVDPADKFNWSKSGIKASEAMAAHRTVNGKPAGACVIATDLHIYREVVVNRDTGILVEHTPDQWEKAISQAIEDEALRHRSQISGHKWVMKHRNIRTMWKHWAKAYQEILSA
jgi:glycosyltransferase involved in cell wall biosynthesis